MNGALYLLGSSDSSGSRYFIRRKADNSSAGYISKVDEQWTVEEVPERFERLFQTCEEAALFACMRDRAFQFFIDSPEPIEIRASPNFGEWRNCDLSHWVASLHDENGATVGAKSSPSLVDAKAQGVRLAKFQSDIDQETLRRISEEADWKIIHARNQIEPVPSAL